MMQRSVGWWIAAVAALLAACGGEDDTTDPGNTAPSCKPVCGDCQVCDTSGSTPTCVDLCGSGTTCQNGACVGAPSSTCSPACGACHTCDTSGTNPVCVDACGEGTSCQNGACTPDAQIGCDPGCGACQMCDSTGASPVCVDACGDGTSCENGACVPDAQIGCDPACGACQMCDTSGATPVCVDNCGEGLSCQNGQCVAPEVVACDPACGDCQMCDTSGATPACVDNCAPGLACDNGACVLPDPCNGTCATCEMCDTTHGVPFCVDSCMPSQTCDKAANLCRPDDVAPTFDHSALPQLQGPFTADVPGGKAVTAQCLTCHAGAGQDMLKSAHWKWVGPTPNDQAHPTGESVGKKNLVNNFCVAIPSNEARCSQCHAGYGYGDKTFDFTNPGAIDCLACHATASYSKAPGTAGGPAPTVDMAAAAKSVGRPTRTACGRCHFGAGGGDNVKKGDIGSALANPTFTTDVHMGKASKPFDCASCHVATAHKIPGQGVHLPVNEGRFDCIDCHGSAPHTNEMVNNHALDIACQTCHIPAFSRQQPTKMNWDWSTAGDKSRGTNGVETGTLPDGTTVTVYDNMKGDFVWEKNVRPEYAWYDGRVERMTISDSYASGQGTQANPVFLGGPVADKEDAAALIFPFKVMRGQQPVDTTTRVVLSPKLFGPGGFWATIPATYDAQVVENNWTNALTTGARYAGQIGETESFTGRATGAKPWNWAYTEMWMGINHEVAPKSSALGCASCHSGAPDWDWVALGYACDPMLGNPEQCGSRHP
jgi:octaheme c-type cytochrome (tetrathionate reductase family)